MKSKAMLAFHTLMFSAFSAGALSSPFIAFSYPTIPGWYFLSATVVLFVFVVGSWTVFGGCPFTVWENNFREQERRGSAYEGPCIDHYAYEWFGLQVQGQRSTIVLVALLLLPGAVGLLRLIFE